MQRVLDGLQGAASSSGVAFDRGMLQKLLASLGNRVFLMNNVHEDHPVVFQVRWVMSYLSGPLSRNLIKKLMDPIRPAKKAVVEEGEGDGFAPPGASKGSSAGVRNTIKPKLPEGVEETHVSLFDGSNCGIAIAGKRAFGVQYHPEASPGPQDSFYLFERFVGMLG